MSKEQEKDLTADVDDGGKRRDAQADEGLKAQLKEVNDKLAEITSAKDRQSNELTEKYQKEKSKLETRIAEVDEENKKAKAELEARAAEDKAELDELISEMNEDGQKAIAALPGSPSAREQLKYIKANKTLFFAKEKKQQAFGQPTKTSDQESSLNYQPASLASLRNGGAAAIKAERERLDKAFADS